MVDELFEMSEDGAFILRLQVHPGAGRTSVVGRHGDAVKVKVAAPPEQGRANDACVKLLAEVLGVDGSQISVVSGEGSRSKRVAVAGMEREVFEERLEVALADAPVGGGNARGRAGVPGLRRR